MTQQYHCNRTCWNLSALRSRLLAPASKCLPPCCWTCKLPHPPVPASLTSACPQGRLPIRVELKGLTAEDFYRILTEPENNMLRQQQVRREGAVESSGMGDRCLDGHSGGGWQDAPTAVALGDEGACRRAGTRSFIAARFAGCA